MAANSQRIRWQYTDVKSPVLDQSVSVIAAKGVPYTLAPNCYQNVHVYVPRTTETEGLVGSPFDIIPGSHEKHSKPRYHVHIHGGAWRDPDLTATSIEATVALAFSGKDDAIPVKAIIGINYTLSPFPTHPKKPYDPAKGDRGQPGREAKHPKHVHDALMALSFLRTQGLADDSYVLTAHSCGACIAFQAVLRHPKAWGFDDVSSPPRPAAVVGMNGLYHLPALVDGLDETHEYERDDYISLISQAYGKATGVWEASSPALFDTDKITELVQQGIGPMLVIIDQSTDDQLVPMNQRDFLISRLRSVGGLRVVEGKRCTGDHTAPWKRGDMIWQLLQDALGQLS